MKLFFTLTFILAGVVAGKAQIAAGGAYTLNKSVIASGGGTSGNTTGNGYTVNGTAGQPAAGATSSGGSYVLKSGFFTAAALAAPTAAPVSISGRAMTSTGRGIRNVLIRLTDGSGEIRYAYTTAFGYYHFADVNAGETVVVTATGKRFMFEQPTQILNLNEDAAEVNFIAY